MNKNVNEKRKGDLIVFWIILGIVLGLLFLKIYYIIDIGSQDIITNIENGIVYFSSLYDFTMGIFVLLLILSGIILKIQKQKIFKDKKLILIAFALAIIIVTVVMVINNNSERNLLIEGEFVSRNYQWQLLNNLNK